jgi:hypothetical protein
MEEIGLIEQTKCSLYELKYLLPAEDRVRHLFYMRIMSKARPELERQAAVEAKTKREAEAELGY